MPTRHLAAACLFLAASAALAADPPAAGTPAQGVNDPVGETAPADAPPVIEVVREGPSVTEAWRREGVDFPAYGPDGEPVAPSVEAQALQALARAYDIAFVALAIAPQAAPSAPCRADCVGDLAVRGRVPVQSIAHFRLAQATGRSWLRERSAAAPLCIPEYRHALTYSADGRAWEVLLCYACGQYLLRRDGVQVGEGHADAPTGQAEFDALLASAGIAAEPAAAAD